MLWTLCLWYMQMYKILFLGNLHTTKLDCLLAKDWYQQRQNLLYKNGNHTARQQQKEIAAKHLICSVLGSYDELPVLCCELWLHKPISLPSANPGRETLLMFHEGWTVLHIYSAVRRNRHFLSCCGIILDLGRKASTKQRTCYNLFIMLMSPCSMSAPFIDYVVQAKI